MLKVRNKELAHAVGLAPSRITQLKQEGVITPDQNGLYDLELDSEKIGRPVNLENFKTDIDEAEVIDFQKWRALKMKEDALKSQRERQVIEKDLLERDEVLRVVGNAFHNTKTKLLTIPTSICQVVAIESDAGTVKEIIEGSIREILAELSSQVAVGLGDHGIPEAPTQAVS